MPAQKKIWVYNGSVAQYPESFLLSRHGQVGCTTCHGGDDQASTRTLAHDPTWKAIPGASVCGACHDVQMEGSLHVTLGGYVTALDARGFDFADPTSAERFNEQCTRCHIANEDAEPACGHCHVSVPQIANGGFLNGHNFRKTPDMERNCTACHGSRVKDEFFGLNSDLIERNDLGLAPVEPDIHFAETQKLNADGLPYGCTFCHSGNEMHGEGHPATGDGDRYDVSTAPACEDCHGPGSNGLGGSIDDFNAVSMHTVAGGGTHLTNLACQACHAQPYKNCFGCHTDVDQNPESETFGKPFYRINEGDPTLPDRSAINETAAPDALMTFRIGRNPLFGEPGRKKFALLRHVPVDSEVFEYSLPDAVEGLIPSPAAAPTWKYATPHNIQTRLDPDRAIFQGFDVTNCGNCHGAAYSQFWLTDPVADSEGWVQQRFEADEDAANAGVLQPLPLEYSDQN